MSFGVISYILLKKHRSATPIDHPDESVTRAKLEYPTEDVNMVFLLGINKAVTRDWRGYLYGACVETCDAFTDKAIEVFLINADHSIVYGRRINTDNYHAKVAPVFTTEDFMILKISANTLIILATESVDLTENYGELIKLEVVGSTVKGYRRDMTTPKLTATDTDIASGTWGQRMIERLNYAVQLPAWLRAPASSLPPARAIIETEITGSGSDDDPYRPDLLHQIEDHPELGRIDKLSITWGSFDHKHTHSHMLLIVTGDNPYESGAIGKQKEYAKRVFDPPSDYAQAVELYRKLRHDYPDWVAGKDNFVYHVLGWSVLELFAIADCYYGFLIEHKTRPQYDQIKRVPDWELRRTINRWLGKLKSLTVLTEERNKHIKKLEEVLRLGW